MIEFEKVKIKNFMSIGEATLPLNLGGFTLISGENHRVEDASFSNGSGKSSCFEAIIYALTGETIRGYKDVVNKYSTGDCSVEVFFEFKGHSWAVKRSVSRDKEKSLEIVKDGNLMQAKGYRDAQEVLSKELPELTFKFLNSVIVLGQGLPGRFTNNTPSGRKAILEELTNADFMITQIKDKINARSSALQNKQSSLLLEKAAVESKKEWNEKSIGEIQSSLEGLNKVSLEDLKSKLEELEVKGILAAKDHHAQVEKTNVAKEKWSNLSESRHEIETKYGYRVDEAQRNYTEERSRIDAKYLPQLEELNFESRKVLVELGNTYNSKVKTVNEEFLHRESDLMNTQTQLSLEKRDLVEKRSHLEAKVSGGYCSTCGQKLPSVSQEEIEQAKAELGGVISLLEKNEEASQALSIQKTNLHKEKETKLDSLAEEYDSQVKAINSDSATKRKDIEDQMNFEKEAKEKALSNILEKISAEKAKDLEDIQSQVNAAYEEFSKYQEEERILQTNLVYLRESYSSLKADIENRESREAELKDQLEKRKEDITKSEEELVSIQVSLEDVQKRAGVLGQMSTFASRDFRGILLEDIIQRLDRILKGYSQLVYGNQLTHFYQEGNWIVIEFDGKEYEALSGGEQQKLNVLIQLSLRDLIIEMTGLRGSFLAVDEVFDGLDITGCEKMVELFQNIDTSIFIISHHAESLNIPYDYKITVVKAEDGVASLVVD